MSIQTVIAKIKWLASYGKLLEPELRDIVLQVEREFPKTEPTIKRGKEKLARAKQLIAAYIERGRIIKGQLEPYMPIIELVIARIVKELTRKGVFK